MSGPRVTTGVASKQDYGTPADFMAAVALRYGEVQLDLAAHRGNRKHERYFAPPELCETFDPKKQDPSVVTRALVDHGADATEAGRAVINALTDGKKTEVRVRNHDTACLAFDSFKQDWAAMSARYSTDGRPALLFLNCEFSDVTPWARRCAKEAKRGANVVLLTPAVVANWYRDIIAGVADVAMCSGRLMFDGKNVYPKDCMVSHFHPGATGRLCIWEWRTNHVTREWVLV